MKLKSLIATSVASIALLAGAPALADNHAGHMDHAGHAGHAEHADHAAHSDHAAHADHAAHSASALPSGPEGPALWKVSDEDTTIYLFGTVHVLPPELQWYDAEIHAALASADTVVTEVDMSKEGEARQQQLAMQMGVAADGKPLRSRLSDEQKVAYDAALAGLGMPPEALDQLKPWLASLTLGFLPLMMQGYDLESGVDKVIIGKSGETAKEELETIEFQLGIFDGLSEEAQIAYLMDVVEDLDEVKPTIDAMVTEWFEGDPEGLSAIMNEGFEADPVLAEALLFARNRNWAEWIDARLDSTPGTVFIAVGAGHLAGEKSVQDYLAEREIETVRVQ